MKNLPETTHEWTLQILAMDLGYPISHYSQLTLNVLQKNSTIIPLIIKEDIKKIGGHQLGIIDTCNLPNKFSPIFEKLNNNLFLVDENAAVKTV